MMRTSNHSKIDFSPKPILTVKEEPCGKRASKRRASYKLPQDRNGTFFIDGCRVHNIYADMFGTVTDMTKGDMGLDIHVQYDGKTQSQVVMSACLEVVGGGIKSA